MPFDEPEDGLVGKAWGGTLRVLRSRDTADLSAWDDDCPPGESGHVWINTPALMKGYLDRDDLTSEVVSQGWFSTGDIGLLDERGYLYLRGREREEINKGGMKVYPGDVDAVIERFTATIGRVRVRDRRSSCFGEDVAAAVVLEHDGSTRPSSRCIDGAPSISPYIRCRGSGTWSKKSAYVSRARSIA